MEPGKYPIMICIGFEYSVLKVSRRATFVGASYTFLIHTRGIIYLSQVSCAARSRDVLVLSPGEHGVHCMSHLVEEVVHQRGCQEWR